jgi:hypothetical protein
MRCAATVLMSQPSHKLGAANCTSSSWSIKLATCRRSSATAAKTKSRSTELNRLRRKIFDYLVCDDQGNQVTRPRNGSEHASGQRMRQPGGVAHRHEGVLLSLPDLDRLPNLVQVESPFAVIPAILSTIPRTSSAIASRNTATSRLCSSTARSSLPAKGQRHGSRCPTTGRKSARSKRRCARSPVGPSR